MEHFIGAASTKSRHVKKQVNEPLKSINNQIQPTFFLKQSFVILKGTILHFPL